MQRRGSGSAAVDLRNEPGDEGPSLSVVPDPANTAPVEGPGRVVIRLWVGAVNGRTRWLWSLASPASSHAGVEATVRRVLAHTPVPPVDECWDWLAEVLVEAWGAERNLRPAAATLPALEVEPRGSGR